MRCTGISLESPAASWPSLNAFRRRAPCLTKYVLTVAVAAAAANGHAMVAKYTSLSAMESHRIAATEPQRDHATTHPRCTSGSLTSVPPFRWVLMVLDPHTTRSFLPNEGVIRTLDTVTDKPPESL